MHKAYFAVVFVYWFWEFSCFVSPPKQRNEVQYTEQEETSRITNFNFFGSDLIETLRKRMD